MNLIFILGEFCGRLAAIAPGVDISLKVVVEVILFLLENKPRPKIIRMGKPPFPSISYEYAQMTMFSIHRSGMQST